MKKILDVEKDQFYHEATQKLKYIKLHYDLKKLK